MVGGGGRGASRLRRNPGEWMWKKQIAADTQTPNIALGQKQECC